jgi:hypothetical protein
MTLSLDIGSSLDNAAFIVCSRRIAVIRVAPEMQSPERIFHSGLASLPVKLATIIERHRLNVKVT